MHQFAPKAFENHGTRGQLIKRCEFTLNSNNPFNAAIGLHYVLTLLQKPLRAMVWVACVEGALVWKNTVELIVK